MFDGNQVLRFEKYKSSDLGGLGVELEDRKGTGNYEKIDNEARNKKNLVYKNEKELDEAAFTFNYKFILYLS